MSDCTEGGCECCSHDATASGGSGELNRLEHACSQKLLEACDLCGVGPGDMPSRRYLERLGEDEGG